MVVATSTALLVGAAVSAGTAAVSHTQSRKAAKSQKNQLRDAEAKEKSLFEAGKAKNKKSRSALFETEGGVAGEEVELGGTSSSRSTLLGN